MDSSTYFGYEQVSPEEKKEKVDDIFTNVSAYYRIMNDVMCCGTHHIWRSNAVMSLNCQTSDVVMDVACGTGECGEIILDSIPDGHLYCVDQNQAMIDACKNRLPNQQSSFICASAEDIPTLPTKVDRSIICFGIRNFTDPLKALRCIFDRMRVGGKIVILEFNPPESSSVETAYRAYIDNVLPKLGEKIMGDAYSYQYLADSIQQEPSPQSRKEMISSAGFDSVVYNPLSLGILGLFEAYKYT